MGGNQRTRIKPMTFGRVLMNSSRVRSEARYRLEPHDLGGGRTLLRRLSHQRWLHVHVLYMYILYHVYSDLLIDTEHTSLYSIYIYIYIYIYISYSFYYFGLHSHRFIGSHFNLFSVLNIRPCFIYLSLLCLPYFP